MGAELGYQTGLTDLPPTANHEETALAVAPNVVQVSTEPRQLVPPANEADVTHIDDTNLRDTINGSRRWATCGPTEDVCAVPATGVFAEAMVALVLAETLRNVRAYRDASRPPEACVT